MIESPHTYKVACETPVLVSDKYLRLHQHVMISSRVFRADTQVSIDTKGFMFKGVDSDISRSGGKHWSPAALANLNMKVFVTGHSKWPYLIIECKHLRVLKR